MCILHGRVTFHLLKCVSEKFGGRNKKEKGMYTNVNFLLIYPGLHNIDEYKLII